MIMPSNFLIYILPILAIPFGSWVDRQRGTTNGTPSCILNKPTALFLLGLLASALLLDHSVSPQLELIHIAIVTLAVSGGYNWWGFGEPIGHALTGEQHPAEDGSLYEFWQIKPFRQNAWVSLFVYGAILFPISLFAIWGIFNFAFILIHEKFYMEIPLSWVIPIAIKLAIAHGIAWPSASAFVRYMLHKGQSSGAFWYQQEYTRGAIQTAILVILYFVW